MRQRRLGWLILSIGAVLNTSTPGRGENAPIGGHPLFQPSTLKREGLSQPNRVMVVGSIHLSSLPADFDPRRLDPLLDRLASWQPTAISIEALPGLQCDAMRRYAFRYASSVGRYCADPTPAAHSTGLDVASATAEVERALADWPAEPGPQRRRHLAALFLAAGDPASAMVQWLSLPGPERHAGDGLDDPLVTQLRQGENKRDETVLVAVRLAVRLGLQRVWPVDDHTADSDTPLDTPGDARAYGAALSAAWQNPANRERATQEARLIADIDGPDGVLALYRALNAPGMGMVVYQSDFGAALREPSPQGYGRQYVGYWETRNLRIAANIREIVGQHPGMRLMSLIGASHRPYLEAYLDQMHDVSLDDVEALLH
jgi:Family of unknown function (DUF5694)